MHSLRDQPFLVEVRLLRDKVPSWDQYPIDLPVTRSLETIAFHPRVTFFIGENGTGKSTLLEAMAVGLRFNPEGGSRNFRFSTRASHSQLDRFLRLSRSARRMRDGFFFRAESYYNLATEIEKLDAEEAAGPPIIGAYGGRSLHEQSHGQSFLALFSHRLRGDGLYLVDEPEAALSPNRQLALLSIIHDLVGKGSQFIIATHSPLIMAYPNAWIYLLLDDKIERVEYTDTEHFALTRAFLNDHRRMLRRLLDDEAL
ncbi:MAG: AAA family ATPase [Gemmatimonadetes bacterium]|nr:MAG: AAA family ATPase [Gemmatimonadota bacterium]